MPHRDEFDDADDFVGQSAPTSRMRKGGGFPIWLIYVLAIGAPLLLLAVFVAVVTMFWARIDQGLREPKGASRVDTPAKGDLATKRVYSRDEFQRAVMGANEGVLLNLLGKPARTRVEMGSTAWTYENVTMDPATGSTDSITIVWMTDQGKVTSVDYIRNRN